ncbi:MetQ/NlpA family ABC transporter substrate-binding protein, partial [Salmonella enterica subsp. enterica serovar Infantis]
QSLRIEARTLLLACGLQFAHADGSQQTIVIGVAPGTYVDMVKQAIATTLKEKGYKLVVRVFSDYVHHNMALANVSIEAILFLQTLYFDK